jgi:pimeloyl-ACP methyl ester carboxylesterase
MQTIYSLSGLGADEKVFSNLKIEGYQLKVIDWIDPLKNETIEAYALRMIGFINEEKPILMGLSFGGIMSIEIAKQIPVKKIILISSIKTKHELPLWMRLVAKTRLHKLYSMKSYRITRPFQNFFLGATTISEKAMANAYRKNAQTGYVKWAVDKVLNWKNETIPQNLYHIHGNTDKMFPVKKAQPHAIIVKGQHLMVMNKAAEISSLINQYLAD